MKYAVIAALLATAQAAKCEAGIKTKIYKDDKCAEEAQVTIVALESDVE